MSMLWAAANNPAKSAATTYQRRAKSGGIAIVGKDNYNNYNSGMGTKERGTTLSG